MHSTASGAGAWGGVVFVAIHVVVCLGPVPRSGLAAMAGSLFGLSLGATLSVMGSVLAALVTFALARRFGRASVAELSGRRIDRVQRALHDRGLVALITARLTPIAPFVLTNYGAGLSRVRARDYVVSLLALVPGSIAWATVGAGAGADGRVLQFTATGAAVLLVGVALARHGMRRAMKPVRQVSRLSAD